MASQAILNQLRFKAGIRGIWITSTHTESSFFKNLAPLLAMPPSLHREKEGKRFDTPARSHTIYSAIHAEKDLAKLLGHAIDYD